MIGRDAVKYLVNEKYYLIESPEEKGKYIGCKAIDEEDAFAMQYAAEDDNVILFNKSGAKIGYKTISSGVESQKYFDKVTNFIRSYNGQETYYEARRDFILPNQFVVIP